MILGNKKSFVSLSICLLLTISINQEAASFTLSGVKWSTNSTTMYINLPEGKQFNDAFEQAMTSWNNATNFTFNTNRTFVAPCSGEDNIDFKNGVSFSNTICGDSFGASTLAVTHTFYYLSNNNIVETDIIFNNTYSWDVFSGSQNGSRDGKFDFRRVAVHELGHALGLGHESFLSNSIMSTRNLVTEFPQQDDINGVAAIYGGLPTPPPVTSLAEYNLLWRNKNTGENTVYNLGGHIISALSSTTIVSDTHWKVKGNADFNGDGKLDVLWRNSVTGENGFFIMNGSIVTEIVLFRTVADLNWKIVGVGDFNNDNRADIFWRNSSTGENYMFLMNGATIISLSPVSTVADNNWKVAGVGDLNGDSKDDIVWRNTASGENWIYLMNGTTISQSSSLFTVADQNWQVAGVGDFNNDNKDDILWRNNQTGLNWMFQMNGTTIITSSAVNTVADLNWKVEQVTDFNNDGNADIFWRNSSTGQNWMFQMNSVSITKSAEVNSLSLDWEVVPN